MAEYTLEYRPEDRGNRPNPLEDTFKELAERHGGHLQFSRWPTGGSDRILLKKESTKRKNGLLGSKEKKESEIIADFSGGSTTFEEVSAAIQSATGKQPKPEPLDSNLDSPESSSNSQSDLEEIQRRLENLDREGERGESEDTDFEERIDELREQAGLDKPEFDSDER